MTEILNKRGEANVIVLATLTFFYSVTGQMKVFINRTFPCFMDIKKDFYFIVTAVDDNKLLEPVMITLKGYVDCFEKPIESSHMTKEGY